MNAGWRFTIPIYSRVGNGYVYSSKFISDEEAEKELRESLGEFDAPAKFLKMKCGRHTDIAHKNVCAVGLSAGFVEPLEATGITFTTAVVKSITDLLNMQGNLWNNTSRSNLNRGFYEMAMEILCFVWAHYYFCTKDNTEYWKHIRTLKIDDLPQDVQYVLSAFYPHPPRYMFFGQGSMFCAVQWFSVLHAGGAYKNKYELTPRQEQYARYFIANQQNRVDLAKEIFPNQYDYLKEWYEND